MIRWYADNSEYQSPGATVPDILLFGGIVASDSARDRLCSIIRGIKLSYNPKLDFPLKWCFRDLKPFYEKQNLNKLYLRLLRDSNTWRRGFFQKMSLIDFKIILSIIGSFGRNRETVIKNREQVARFGFSNALQRVGLFIRDHPSESAEVILDWPDKARRGLFDLEYKSAFSQGKSAIQGHTYDCGALKDLGFSDSVFFTSMNNCSLLQISDLIVGAAREFIQEAIEEKDDHSLGFSLMKLLRSNFYGSPDNIFGRGISFSPRQGSYFIKVQNKVAELNK